MPCGVKGDLSKFILLYLLCNPKDLQLTHTNHKGLLNNKNNHPKVLLMTSRSRCVGFPQHSFLINFQPVREDTALAPSSVYGKQQGWVQADSDSKKSRFSIHTSTAGSQSAGATAVAHGRQWAEKSTMLRGLRGLTPGQGSWLHTEAHIIVALPPPKALLYFYQ